jgi:hypothetical protein
MPRSIKEISQGPEWQNMDAPERAKFISSYYEKYYKPKFTDKPEEGQKFLGSLLAQYGGNPPNISFQTTPAAPLTTRAEPTYREGQVDFPSAPEAAGYGFARFGSAIERAAAATGELATGLLELPAQFAEEALGVEGTPISGPISRAREYYAHPERTGMITPWVSKKAEQYRQAYETAPRWSRMLFHGAETGIDLEATIAQMLALGVMGRSSPKVTPLATKPAVVKAAMKRFAKTGAHAFTTTPGSFEDRLRAASYRVAVNATPHIVQGMGISGVAAPTVDTMLNMFVSSPTYFQAAKESENIGEFIENIAPTWLADVGFAITTKGDPQKSFDRKFDRYWKHRVRQYGVPKKEAKIVVDQMRQMARNKIKLDKVGKVAELIDIRNKWVDYQQKEKQRIKSKVQRALKGEEGFARISREPPELPLTDPKAQAVEQTTKEQIDALRQDEKVTFGKAWESIKKHGFDIRSPAKNMLRKTGTRLAQQVEMRSDAVAGGHSYGVFLADAFKKSAFKDLDARDMQTLGTLLQASRIIEIDRLGLGLKYFGDLSGATKRRAYDFMKATGGFEGSFKEFAKEYNTHKFFRDGTPEEIGRFWPKDQGPEHQQAWIDDAKKAYATEGKDWGKIERAQGLIKDLHRMNREILLKEGLITQEGFDELSLQENYHPFLYLHHLDNTRIRSYGGKPMTVTDSGLKSLERGSKDLLVFDPDYLITRSLVATWGRVAQNRANKTLFEYARAEQGALGDQPWVRPAKALKTSKSGKVQYEKTPSGYSKVTAMVDGSPKVMFMQNRYANSWAVSDPVMNSRVAGNLRKFSLSGMVRYFATGPGNPAFGPINFILDAWYQWFTAYPLQKEMAKMHAVTKGQGAYSPHFLPAAYQWIKSLKSVKGDVWAKNWEGTKVEDYAREGGMMDWMSIYGKPRYKVGPPEIGKYHHHVWRKYNEMMTKWNSHWELWNRMATRDRYVRQGYSGEEATLLARRVLDFSQGGDYTKMADAFMPYLNAYAQVSRGFGRAIKEHPAETAMRIGSLSSLGVGLSIASYMMAPELHRSVPEDTRSRNLTIPMPMMYDEDNQGRQYGYVLTLPIPEPMAAIINVADAAVGKLAFGYTPTKARWKAMGKANITSRFMMPVPVLAAAYGYFYNKNWYYNSETMPNADKIADYGETAKTVPEFYNMIGEATKGAGLPQVSPRRLENAAGALITHNNFFVEAMGGTKYLAFAALDKEQRKKTTRQILAETPGLNRILKRVMIVDPKAQEDAVELTNEYGAKRNLLKVDLKKQMDLYWDGTKSRSDVQNWIATLPMDTEMDRMLRAYAFRIFDTYEKNKGLPIHWWDMFDAHDDYNRAAIFYGWQKNAPNEAARQENLEWARKLGYIQKYKKTKFSETLNILQAEDRKK